MCEVVKKVYKGGTVPMRGRSGDYLPLGQLLDTDSPVDLEQSSNDENIQLPQPPPDQYGFEVVKCLGITNFKKLKTGFYVLKNPESIDY